MTWFDAKRFHDRREELGAKWGTKLDLFDSIESTNDQALQAVSAGGESGTVWIAREQTSGRGRRGNSWVAAPGECLTLSTVVHYRGEPERMMGLSLVVGLAVREVVQRRLQAIELDQRGLQATVKWPNDVLVDGKKLAGILVETRSAPDGSLGIVIGLGLNVSTRDFPPELPEATSLALLGVDSAGFEGEVLAADLVHALETKSQFFFERGFSPFLSQMVQADFLYERRFQVGRVVGIGRGFDGDGRLLVEDESGEVKPVMSGHVELRR